MYICTYNNNRTIYYNDYKKNTATFLGSHFRL